MKFGQNLKSARIARGLTANDLAKEIGASVSMISYYESEKRSPSIKTAEKLAKICGTTLAELVAEETETAQC